MKIFDCFMYFDEDLLLDLRLNILDKFVDKFVIVESNLTHTGKLKELVKDNLFLISGDHNEDGARVLNDYLNSLDCKKHLIIGMMANKQHEKYISYFKDITSITCLLYTSDAADE